MTPKVSVLVTVFNREKFLAACLESILASVFRDFEVVVVDDGSTDKSLEVAKSFEVSDNRIRVTKNPVNLGDYPNRMRAAELATGRYLKYVDSDDLIYPHGLGVMVDALDRYPDAGFALSHSRAEDEHPYPWRLTPVEAWRKEFLGDGCLSAGPTGAIARREQFFSAGGFGPWGVLSDTDMWYRMSARWPVVLLPPGLVWWRRHDDQEFSRNDADVVYLEKGLALVESALSSKDCPLSPSEVQSARARSRQHFARKALSLGLRNRRPAAALRALRRSGLSLPQILEGFSSYR